MSCFHPASSSPTPKTPERMKKATSNQGTKRKHGSTTNYDELAHKVQKIDRRPRQTVLNDLWEQLKVIIRQTYVPSEKRVRISNDDYMKLYRLIHKLCTMQPDEQAFRSIRRFNVSVSAPLLQLYNRIAQFYKVYLHNVGEEGKRLSDPKEFLTFYSKQCSDFYSSSKILSGICAYLNRNWNANKELKQEKGLDDIYVLALNQWRDTLFKSLHTIVTGKILQIIHNDRIIQIQSGDYQTHRSSHQGEIREVIDSYVAIGGFIKENNQVKQNLSIYQKYFEEEFLDATKQFYQDRINDLIDRNEAGKTLLVFESIIHSEEARVQEILHKSTLRKVVAVCLKTLVEENVPFISSVFKQILENQNQQLLKSLYGIINRISPEQVSQMANKFRQYLIEIALTKFNSRPTQRGIHPAEQFCSALIEFMKAYKKVVKVAFDKAIEFVQALDQAWLEILNQTEGELGHIARYLAHFANAIITTRGTTDLTKMKKNLTKVGKLITFIRDKDLFQNINILCMQNRLIDGTSSSEDIERFFIDDVLKTACVCDSEYIHKLKTTFQDAINNSKVLNAGFKTDYPPIRGQPDLNAFVIASSASPIAYPATEFVFPEPVQPLMKHFKEFYKARYPSRKLNWIAPKCTGEMTYKVGGKEYLLVVSIYEMAVLTLFNNIDQYTLSEMQNLIKLETKKLEAVIKNLVEADLLLKEAPSNDASPPEEVIIKINQAFTDKRYRIKLNTKLKSEARRELVKIDEHVEKWRERLIGALIVHIMKSEKEYEYQKFILDFFGKCQTKHGFKPEGSTINKQIAVLLEKKYLMVKGTKDDEKSVLRGNCTLVYMA